jgi:hypothetical protein
MLLECSSCNTATVVHFVRMRRNQYIIYYVSVSLQKQLWLCAYNLMRIKHSQNMFKEWNNLIKKKMKGCPKYGKLDKLSGYHYVANMEGSE